MSKRLILGIAVLAALCLAACDGATDGTDTATTQPTAAATTTAPPTGDVTSTPTATTEPDDTYPLVYFQSSGGWHNHFAFEIENYILRYRAIRYDYYLLDSDSINGVRAGDYIAYVGDLWNDYNDCFLVYYSRLTGKLHYKVIDPYAIPGTDPDRGDMAATHEGILEASATSVPANYVRFTYWGKYGIHVNWTDDYGQGHYAVIDQWNGLTEKGDSDADDRPAVRDAIARGRVLPRPDYLEIAREGQEEVGCVVNWVNEDDNHLEFDFDRNGGDVIGSFWWRHSMNFHWPEDDPDWPRGTITTITIGDMTGTWSGGETGSFEGALTGSMTSTYNGAGSESSVGTIDGAWWAEMDAGGHITGTIQYTMTFPEAVYEDWLDFEAYLE